MGERIPSGVTGSLIGDGLEGAKLALQDDALVVAGHHFDELGEHRLPVLEDAVRVGATRSLEVSIDEALEVGLVFFALDRLKVDHVLVAEVAEKAGLVEDEGLTAAHA